jgi:hypothetical protein
MSAKHTLGPWKYTPSTNLVEGCIESGAQEYEVCTVSDNNSNPQNVANARLIAAAPDLLEALLLMVDNFGPTPSELIRGLGPARAAIARARGEA